MSEENMSHPKYVAAYLSKFQKTLLALNVAEMDAGIEQVRAAWERGAQIITLGNGGSAMTALHFITDWSKMIHLHSGRPFRGRTLVDNIGLMTAYSNDISYADVFRKQLENIMSPGDLVVAISGSGNSENIIRAVEYANAHGGHTLGLSGFSGGRLKQSVQTSIWVDVNDMQIVEDVHAIFGHIVMQAMCHLLPPERL